MNIFGNRIITGSELLIAIIPIVVLAAIFHSPIVLLGFLIAALSSALLETGFSLLTRSRFDIAIIPCGVIVSFILPASSGMLLYAAAGAIAFLTLTIRRFSLRYFDFSPLALACIIVGFMFGIESTSDSAARFELPENVLVKNLLIGNYEAGAVVASSSAAIIIALILLMFMRRVRFFDVLASVIVFGLIISFYYTGGPLSVLTTLSFMIFDGRMLLAFAIVGALRGYTLPYGRIMSIVWSAAIGALAALFVYLRVPQGVFIAIFALSVLSLNLEKFAFRKGMEFLSKC